jgi:hypothetical protein
MSLEHAPEKETPPPEQDEDNVSLSELIGQDDIVPFNTLVSMHQYRRPDMSRSERAFINEFIEPLGVETDGYGNLYKIVGENPTILWSCHTDTVHTRGGMQKLEYIYYKSDKSLFMRVADESKPDSNCLGADDGAGVFLLTEMIKAGIPGFYIFHRLEESGMQGSAYFVKKHAAKIKGIQAAIAFDRRGYDSIITFQSGERCCSEAFARSLAVAIDMGHKPDPTGSFTDTKQYTDLVPECTNVSVGYENAHSSTERQDILYILKLRRALLAADFSKLVIERVPGTKESRWGGGSGYYAGTGYTPYSPGAGSKQDQGSGWGGGWSDSKKSRHHKKAVKKTTTTQLAMTAGCRRCSGAMRSRKRTPLAPVH